MRPPPKKPLDPPESADPGPFAGLADVLEPDPDAITSLHRLGVAASSRASLRTPLDAPTSVRAPVPLHDFAFADTVFANELADDEPPPPSNPIFVRDESGSHTQCVTPLAFPLPPASENVDTATWLRVLFAHARHGLRHAIEEMRELWAGTGEIVAEQQHDSLEGRPLARFVRRLLALWSCFQWSRADVVRAAMIGVAVFVTAGTIGAVTLDTADSTGSGSEVRVGRTLVQHTPAKGVVRQKR